MFRSLLLAGVGLLVSCNQRPSSGTQVQLFKGPRRDPEHYLASTFSAITCKELAKGLCLQFGAEDREFACVDGDDVTHVKCPDPVEAEPQPVVKKKPKPRSYFAQMNTIAGDVASHFIQGGVKRTIEVKPWDPKEVLALRCTFKADGEKHIVSGSSCTYEMTNEFLVIVMIESFKGGMYTVTADVAD